MIDDGGFIDAPISRRVPLNRLLAGIVAALVLAPLLIAAGAWLDGSQTRSSLYRLARHGAPTTPAFYYSIGDILTAQARAIVRADEGGWLSQVNPGDARLVGQYRALYDRLEALHPQSLAATPDTHFGSCCSETVRYQACIQDGRCDPQLSGEVFQAHVTWKYNPGGPTLIVGFQYLPPGDRDRTEPMLTGAPLVIASAPGVVVAVSPSLKARLPDFLRRAQAAAAVDNTFAQWDRPQPYIAYLADPTDWKRWFSGPDIDGIEGYAIPTSTSSMAVVIDDAVVRSDRLGLDYVLRHEFGHVITLLGAKDSPEQLGLGFPDRYNVLAEGIAEYIAQDHRPVASYGRLPDVARYLRGHPWDGDLVDISDNLDSHDAATASAAYGLAFLTIACLADHFGEPTMLQYVGDVLHEGAHIESHAPIVLHQPWSAVSAACAAYARSTVDL
jgi:hypothetical protein